LGLLVKGTGRLQKIQALNEFLIAQSKNGGTVVLLVDEAQNLTDDVLENLRLLSNLETPTEKLLQIVLVGQTELDAKLGQPQLRQIKQRVALHCRLDRLKDREVGPFINYRLRKAGYEREDLFTADAIQEVASYSKGIPRLINIICDNALLIGYATTAKKISADIIREVANDLRLNAEGRVADGDPSTAKTVTRVGKNEKETRANIRLEEVASRHPRNLKPVWVGSLAVSILVLLIGGIVFYQPDLDAWLSDVVFGRFKWAKIQSGILPEPSGDSMVVSQGGKSPGTETALASARQTDAAPTPNTAGNAPERLERVSSPSLDQTSAGSTKASAVQNEQSVVIPRGSTISRIATEVYGTDKILLAMDLLKEFNPRIEDMNWVLAGQKLSVPPLTRETLLRRQPDDTYHLILDSFFNAQEAEKLGKTVRLKGYEVAITPRKVSNKLVLHRVEIPGLKNLETANHAWEVATASRWIVVSSGSAPRQVP
jgi:hypothetical protein